MSSENHTLSRLTYSTRVAKRAQCEALEFTVGTGGVRVRNASYTNPADHEYLVTIRDRLPVACECPADERYDGACKHRVDVAIRTPLLEAVAKHSLDADGGTQTAREPNHNAEVSDPNQPADCECDELGGFPCWPCVRTGRRDLPDE
jgi:hypothetical protein